MSGARDVREEAAGALAPTETLDRPIAGSGPRPITARPSPPLVGQSLLHFSIVDRLGEGGMGVVYRAHDAKLSREVAIKVPRDRVVEGGAAARVFREARSAAKIGHPNIAIIHEVHDEHSPPFIVMELVQGRSLRERLGEGPVPVEEARKVADAIAQALAAAHAAGVVHRDLKPENVMLTRAGEVKLLDFGIATGRERPAEPAPATTEVATSREAPIMGTPEYMSPEQAAGEAVDARTNVFSFGAMFYEMLSGRRPFLRDTPAQSLSAVLEDELPPLARVAKRVPSPVVAVVEKCLRKAREERYRDGAELSSALAATVGKTRRGLPKVAIAIAAVAAAAATAAAWRIAREMPRDALEAPTSSAAPVNAGSPSAAPTAVTDLPLPESTNLEALAAYKTGMQATRDGDTVLIGTSFRRAATLNPTMAAAHLRIAFVDLGDTGLETARANYRRALQLRASLSARDLDVMGAYEAVILEPDNAEFERRTEHLAEAYPMDAEIWLMFADAAYLNHKLEDAESRARHAIEIDPKFGYAWLLVAWALKDRGEADAYVQALESCTSATPSAAECMLELLRVRANDGACEAAEDLAKRLVIVRPKGAFARYVRAAALAQSGASRETMLLALQDFAASRYGWGEDKVDLWLGDFAGLLARHAQPSDAGSLPFRSMVDRAAAEVVAWRESGRSDRAGRVAADVLTRRPVVAPDPSKFELAGGGLPILNYVELLGVAHGELTPEAWARERETARAWLERKVGETSSSLWLHLDAPMASTRAEAEAALAKAPKDVSLTTPLDGALLGHVYALAERWGDALLPLERATRACFEFDDLPFYQRAHFERGRAYEVKGDAPRACEEYARVVARWGSALPRSTSAEAAKGRAQALHCRAR